MLSRIYLEITNICNRSCAFCPGTKRAPRALTPEEFAFLAAKLRPHTDYLYLHVMGEPLAHPQLPELLKIAGELGFRVILTTNGTLLAARQEALLSAPCLHKVHISLHSFEANVAGSFDDYLSGCFTFAKLAAETGKLVDLRLWNLDGETTRGQHTQNDAILAALEAVFPQPWTRNTWGLRLCERVFVHYAEKFDWPDLSVSEQRDTGTCRALKDQLAVLSDGTVVPCCLDHEGDVPLGNLFSQELDEILRALPAQALLSGELLRPETLCEIGVNRTGFSHGDGTYRQYLGYLCFSKHPLQRLSEVPHWMGARSIGLSGFTGNHLSLDPDAGRFVLFLGNRCHGRVSHIVPPEGKDLSAYGLDARGVGLVRWSDGRLVPSSAKYVYFKDEMLHAPIESRMRALGWLA